MTLESDGITRRDFNKGLVGVGMVALGAAGVLKAIETDNNVRLSTDQNQTEVDLWSSKAVKRSFEDPALRRITLTNILGLLSLPIGLKGLGLMREFDEVAKNTPDT